MEGNTPGRRPRAVSFTIQIVGADDQNALPNAPNQAGPVSTSTNPRLGHNHQAAQQEDVDKKMAEFQAKLEILSNALVVMLSANQDADAITECVQALNGVSEILGKEEEAYMASPLRCPLIHSRQDYAIGTLASMTIESLYADGHETVLLNYIVEGHHSLPLRLAATRLVCILLEAQPHLVDELAGRFNMEDLVRAVVTGPKGELRTLQTGFLGLSLNDRRSHQLADLAVMPLEIDDPANAGAKVFVSLPKVLVKRLKEELAVELEALPEISSPTLSNFPELEYALRCLSFVGEYQETLSPVLDLGILETLFGFLTSPRSSELGKFYALELCSRLMAHKAFASRFAHADGVSLLLRLPETFSRPLFIYPSVAWCLSGIASLDTIMEHVLRSTHDISKRLVDFGLKLLRGEQDITRKNGLFFFAHAFAFPIILSQFDACDGCRILLDMLANPVSAQRSIAVINLVKHTARTLREYFRAHVAQAAHLVRTTRVVPGEGSRPARATAKRLPLHKPMPLDHVSHTKNMETLHAKSHDVVSFLTMTKWRPVEELLQYRSGDIRSGVSLLLGIVQACSKMEFGANAQESSTAILQVLSIASILPIVHAEICSHPAHLPRSHFRAPTTSDSINTFGAATEVGSRGSGEDGASETHGRTENSQSGRGGAPTTGSTEEQPGGNDRSFRSDGADDDVSSEEDDGHGFSRDETGISLLLRAVSGTGAFEESSPKALVAALQTLCHCLCSDWSGDEASHRLARGIARNNNAVMILLALLNYKEKPSEADPVRFYACDALFGLSGDTEIAEILKALNVDRLLSDIANSEPVVAENRMYHKRLKERALDLLKTISSGGKGEEIALAADAAARKIARDAIVRRSNVQWNQKELMSIIYEHLEKHGCSQAANALALEVGLHSLSRLPNVEHTPHGPGASKGWPTRKCRRRVRSVMKKRMLRPVHHPARKLVLAASARKAPFSTPGKPPMHTPAQPSKDKDEEGQVPINLSGQASSKRRVRAAPTDPDATLRNIDTSGVKRVRLASEFASGTVMGPSPHPTTLEKIVLEHLRHQHQTCRNPVTTPAPFGLLDQHRKHSCPEAKSLSASKDVGERILNRALLPPFGGPKGRQLTMRNVHSKAKWVRSYLLGEDPDFQFTTQAFRVLNGNDDQLAMGTSNGIVHRYSAWTSEYLGAWDLSAALENDEAFSADEDFSLSSLGFSRDGSHFLTSLKGSRSAVVWRVLEENDALVAFNLKDARHAVLDTDGDTIAAFIRNGSLSSSSTGGSSYGSPASVPGVALYSMNTGDQVVRFLPAQGYISNGYSHTNICMSPGGMLVCYDGVLWDARRSPRPIHKFDKLSEFGWGSLHPNGLQLLLNKDVWDLRTFRIVQSCSNALNGSTFRFDPFGDVIYSYQDATKNRTDFASSVVVTDGTEYTNIASLNIDRDIFDLAIHPSGSHFSLILADSKNDMNVTEGRLYEIGRAQPDEDDSDINEPIEQEGKDSGSEEDESDDDDDMGDDDFDGNDEIVLGDLAGNEDFGDAIMRAINMMHNQGGQVDAEEEGSEEDASVYEEGGEDDDEDEDSEDEDDVLYEEDFDEEDEEDEDEEDAAVWALHSSHGS